MTNENNKDEKADKPVKGNKNLVIGVVGIVAIIIIVVLVLVLTSNPTPNPTPNNNITPNAVTISLSDITDAPSFFTYDAQGVAIDYFVIVGSDMDIHTAFDACEVCYDQKKGYLQEGDVMKCVNCGRTFEINGLGTVNVGGGCWPGYLEHTIEDGNIIIRNSDLDFGRWLFV